MLGASATATKADDKIFERRTGGGILPESKMSAEEFERRKSGKGVSKQKIAEKKQEAKVRL